MKPRWSSFVWGFAGALTAVAVLLVVIGVGAHLWADHTALHQLIGIVNTLAARHPELFK